MGRAEIKRWILPCLVLASALLFGAVLTSCGSGSASSNFASNKAEESGERQVSSESQRQQTIWVFGASSLTDVLEELARDFETGSTKINFQFGGSSHLVQQINEGAPADILAVANERVLENLKSFSDQSQSQNANNGSDNNERQDIESRVFAHSRLVIAVPKGNPKNITSLQDLENSRLVLGVCAREVPCGDLAVRTFQQSGLELKPDTRELSARSVLNKLLLGELDIGLIYEVDVLAANAESERLDFVPINVPADASAAENSPTQNNYLAIQIKDSPSAQDFLDYLQSERAGEILLSHGFILP